MKLRNTYLLLLAFQRICNNIGLVLIIIDIPLYMITLSKLSWASKVFNIVTFILCITLIIKCISSIITSYVEILIENKYKKNNKRD